MVVERALEAARLSSGLRKSNLLSIAFEARYETSPGVKIAKTFLIKSRVRAN